MPRRVRRTVLRSPLAANFCFGAVAVLYAGARVTRTPQTTGPVVTAAVAFARGVPRTTDSTAPTSAVAGRVATALDALTPSVRALSHPRALDAAFRSYFAYRAEHADAKSYLYFVDYGLPSTTPRGYVFDMDALRIVEGPFTVAHGRGSSTSQYGVPTRFSDASGSEATSLGLYVAQELYAFRGHASGQSYSSIGLRLMGLSDGYNDNARARRVVAHGAPYVTEEKAGRSEGCPALEPSRAARLLPKLANGGLVFLFAPDPQWMGGDPWLTGRVG